MRDRIALVGLLAVAAGAAATACGSDAGRVLAPDAAFSHAAMPTGSLVTGSGNYIGPNALRTFAFTVRVMPDGSVKGRFSGASHARPASSWSGPLTCVVVEGNVAWIGGIYEKATNPALVGTGFVFKAVDHGEGVAAVPDSMSRAMRGGNDCTLKPEPNPLYFYEIFGNIQVHP